MSEANHAATEASRVLRIGKRVVAELDALLTLSEMLEQAMVRVLEVPRPEALGDVERTTVELLEAIDEALRISESLTDQAQRPG